MNPLIPLYKKTPPRWKEEQGAAAPIASILKGYIDAYDPDFVIAIDCDEKDLPEIGNRQVITPEHILEHFKQQDTTAWGVGYTELLRYFDSKELKFVRRDPIEVLNPRIDDNYRQFLGAVVGILPSDVDKEVQIELQDKYGVSDARCKLANFWEFLTPSKVTPRRLCRQFLNFDTSARMWERRRLLYIDAADINDVLDFWNLRALGFIVFPIPKQSVNDDGLREAIKRFLVESHATHRTDPTVTYDATLVRGRSIDETEFKAFSENLSSLYETIGLPIRRIVQNWFPSFWDESFSRLNSYHRASEYFDTDEISVVADSGRLQFESATPPFMEGFGGGARVANELHLSTFSDEVPVAEVMPRGGKELSESIGVFDFFSRRWRFSSDGLVFFPQWNRESISLNVPASQQILEGWFRSQGWQVTVSPAGRAIRQLLKNLGGKYGVSIIAHEGIVEILSRIAKSSAVSEKWILAELRKIADRNLSPNALGVISRLIEAKLITLGVRLQCPNCNQRPWYNLRRLDYSLRCTKCLTAR